MLPASRAVKPDLLLVCCRFIVDLLSESSLLAERIIPPEKLARLLHLLK